MTSFGNRTSITEPLGWTTWFGYDNRANVIARTNALGQVSRWVFHPFFNKAIQEITPQPLDVNGQPWWTNFYVIDDATGNLLRHDDALGTLVRYTYTTNGLVLTSTDANTNTTRFAYDTNGFLIAQTDPANQTTTFTRNDMGWKLSQTDARNQTTTYAYDLNGNVVRTVDPLQRVFAQTYDANGNLTSASDAKGQFTFHAYDAANQKTQTVDRAGATNRFFYTARGKLERAVDPLNFATTNFYDAANRLVRASDPLGNSITNLYDANGNLVALMDQLGQRWSKTYDRLDRVVAETDPLGNTRQTTYDVAGRILQTITPRGHPSLHAYDGRGRLIRWVDPEGYEWRYTYDGNGNITDIEDALHGHYVMEYGPRNERTLERNQDGFQWPYQYDELLRLKRQTDPNGTTRTLDYDAGGRVLSVTFSTGRVNSFAYDDNDNPEVLARTGSGPPTLSQLRYDALDRVMEYTDAFGKRIRYAYDPRGSITNVTYPDGKPLAQAFDELGRLTSQVFQFGPALSFTNTYAYDRADRLIRRTYPNGVVQSNAFDNAGQITGLGHHASGIPASNSIQIALTYAYDRNGNKIAATEQGTFDWPLPSLRDETARYTASGRLIDRTIRPIAPNGGEGQGDGVMQYRYDPSGNLTNATGQGQSWSLAYDEDNRTTSIAWDCGLTSKRITNRFDALGRRVAKTVDGLETRYVLELAGSMERILCDLAPNGAITAWYVHGPDLCYKVDPAGNLTCYHADAQANIIALTGQGGTNLAQYAYTPYGRSLPSTNLQSQISNPYLFVGSQGVMEELPGLYFMRARYYSAEAGVFLSTDPVKHIGSGWKPVAYAYANGNPLTYNDPERELFNLVTAAIGAAIGGAIDLGYQTIVEGKSLKEVNWVSVGGSALKGGLVGSGFGIVAEVAIGAAIGGATEAISQAVYEGGVKDWGAVRLEAGISGVSTLVGKGAEKLGGAMYDKLVAKGVGRAVNIEGGLAGAVERLATSSYWGPNVDRAVGKAITEGALREIGDKTAQETLRMLSERAVNAHNYAVDYNNSQSTRSSGACSYSGTTSSSSGSKLATSVSGSFSKVTAAVQNTVSKVSNSVSTAVKTAASSAKQSISNAVSSVKSFVSNLFGKNKKK